MRAIVAAAIWNRSASAATLRRCSREYGMVTRQGWHNGRRRATHERVRGERLKVDLETEGTAPRQ